MANFKKTIATAKAKVAKAENEAFAARLEAIDAILQDAAPDDVLTLCAHALADVVPNCCEAHQGEFKAEFLRVLNECVAIREEQDEAEAAEDEGNDVHPQVH
jgi:deoxyxylulose-5-phosphate synthase